MGTAVTGHLFEPPLHTLTSTSSHHPAQRSPILAAAGAAVPHYHYFCLPKSLRIWKMLR
jgi:hypothetical protein